MYGLGRSVEHIASKFAKKMLAYSQQTFTPAVDGGKSGWRQHVRLIDVDIPYVESNDGYSTAAKHTFKCPTSN